MILSEKASSTLTKWHRIAGIASLVFGVTVVFLAYMSGISAHVCCDAVSYGQLATSYQQQGMLAPHDLAKIRTYLYPAFLALVQSSHSLQLPSAGAADLAVAIWQGSLFLGAVLSLFAAVRRLGATAQISVLVGLLCNIFILVYVPVRLTETLSLCCIIITAAVVIELSTDRAEAGTKSVLLFALGSLIAGAAIMIRSANVALAACWGLFSLMYLWCLWRDQGRWRGLVRSAGMAMLGFLAFAGPLIPQWFINQAAFGQGTVFPVVQLGKQQLVWGITHLKYGTAITAEGIKGMVYHNPFVVMEDKYAANPTSFYIENPISGLATIALHTFNSLSFEYLQPYVSNLRPWYMPITLALNHLLVFAGFVTGMHLIGQRFRHWREGSVGFGLQETWWLFMGALVAATCALNSLIAVESRFGLPVLAVFGPLACYGLFQFAQLKNWRLKTGLGLGAFAYIVAAEALAFWMLQTALS